MYLDNKIYFVLIVSYLALLCVSVEIVFLDHNKLWKILQEMGIPDHLTCLLGNLYAGQEAIARTRHGTTDCCSKLGKEYFKAIYCHLLLYKSVPTDDSHK